MSSALSGRRVELSSMRRAIARRTSVSQREVPHFYATAELVLDETLAQLERINEDLPAHEHVSITAVLVRATALALRRNPRLNAVWEGEDALLVSDEVNLSIAVAVDEGLLAPAIFGCDGLDLKQTAAALRTLVARARSGGLRGAELTRGTFTISNLGMFDITQFAAIVMPPQVAVLALGQVMGGVPRYDETGHLSPRSIAVATVSADHRAVDGADVARFLTDLKEITRSSEVTR